MAALFLATLIVFSSLVQANPQIAVAFNLDGKSTSTSNPIEDNIRKGAQLGLKGKSALWINHGESVAQTLSAINEINKIKPRVIVGLGNSFQALLAADRMSAETVLISPVATADAILAKKASILLIGNVNSIQAEILARQIKASCRANAKVMVVELLGCPYCVDMNNAVEINLRRLSIEPTVVQLHTSQIKGSTQTLTRQRNFDHIILPVFEADAARLISSLQPNNPRAVFWGGDGWGSLGRYIKELPGSKSLRAFWLTHYHPSIATAENKVFVRKFREAYGSDPVDTSAFFYEAMLLAQKIVREPNAKRRMLAFARIGRYRGLTGEVKIIGDHVSRSMPLMELVGGSPQFVKMVDIGEVK